VRRIFGLIAFLCVSASAIERPQAETSSGVRSLGCPAEMVQVLDFCIDRFEIGTVERETSEPLSPFYPPEPRLVANIYQSWILERRLVGPDAARELPLPELPLIQREKARYAPRAVSRSGIVPQAYLSYHLAKRACENADKRLCSEREWVTACKGRAGRKFPYGDNFDPSRCNVYRHVHPAEVLHGSASYGHRDPRLNLLFEADGGPLLRLTGGSPGCASSWGSDRIYDMVGNIDEWVEAEPPVFVGGFYARSTREGCEAKVGSHAAAYYDYSTGTRCCRSLASDD
jgi:hypothetical protein